MDKKKYDIIYCLMIPDLGVAGLAKLVNKYGSYSNVRYMLQKEDMPFKGISKAGREAVMSGQVEKDTDKAIKLMKKEDIKLCTIEDDEYPIALLDMENPPPMLFYKGEMKQKERRVAVIGARACSHYGMYVAEEIGRKCGQYGITTVSGLAEGVDGLVHWNTSQNEGRTIAVLAGNIEKPYPENNRKLIKPILDAGGCVMTEVPPGKVIHKRDFILRNRLIAGLSNVLVVVEAGKKSGCFSTVDYMNDIGRDTYAVPGNITSLRSEGTNKMIQQGAHIYTSYDDFLIDTGLGAFAKKQPGFTANGIELSNLDRRILAEVQYSPSTVEQIAEQFSMDVDSVMQSLTFLALFGEVTEVTPGWFVAKS